MKGLGGQKSGLGRLLGVSWGSLGRFLGTLAGLLGVLGVSWVFFDRFFTLWERFWEDFGRVLEGGLDQIWFLIVGSILEFLSKLLSECKLQCEIQGEIQGPKQSYLRKVT